MSDTERLFQLRTCTKCLAPKPLQDFYRHAKGPGGFNSQCKLCCGTQNRECHLKRTFGLTLEEYDRLLRHQKGQCAICGATEPGGKGRFHVDHCHETEEVRALLCSKCNQGLGIFGDSTETLTQAAQYLERFGRNRKTVFTDLDGTLVVHRGSLEDILLAPSLELLPGVREELDRWVSLHYYIVITTGRPEEARAFTVAQLDEAGIPFHQLVMGVGRGQRIIINDLKRDSEEPTAIAICVPRNEGLKNVDL